MRVNGGAEFAESFGVLSRLNSRIWSAAYAELEANEGLFLARPLNAARRQAEGHNRNSIVSLVDKGLAFAGAECIAVGKGRR